MIAFLYQRSSMATLSLRRGGGATRAATVLMGDRGQACGLHGQYVAIAPAPNAQVAAGASPGGGRPGSRSEGRDGRYTLRHDAGRPAVRVAPAARPRRPRQSSLIGSGLPSYAMAPIVAATTVPSFQLAGTLGANATTESARRARARSIHRAQRRASPDDVSCSWSWKASEGQRATSEWRPHDRLTPSINTEPYSVSLRGAGCDAYVPSRRRGRAAETRPHVRHSLQGIHTVDP
jgi:hypothetical protein